jgi:hypothetical protein
MVPTTPSLPLVPPLNGARQYDMNSEVIQANEPMTTGALYSTYLPVDYANVPILEHEIFSRFP